MTNDGRVIIKYIVFSETDGREYPVVFPSMWRHEEVARSFASPNLQIVAAGFIRIAQDASITCRGTSVSLDIRARPERDSLLISQWLAIG